jgi:hypothetical protein
MARIALAELGSKAIRFVPFCGKRPRGSSPVSSCVKAAVEIGWIDYPQAAFWLEDNASCNSVAMPELVSPNE